MGYLQAANSQTHPIPEIWIGIGAITVFFFAIAKAGGGRQGRMRSKTNVNLYGSTIHIVFDGEECIY